MQKILRNSKKKKKQYRESSENLWEKILLFIAAQKPVEISSNF